MTRPLTTQAISRPNLKLVTCVHSVSPSEFPLLVSVYVRVRPRCARCAIEALGQVLIKEVTFQLVFHDPWTGRTGGRRGRGTGSVRGWPSGKPSGREILLATRSRPLAVASLLTHAHAHAGSAYSNVSKKVQTSPYPARRRSRVWRGGPSAYAQSFTRITFAQLDIELYCVIGV